MEVRTLAKHEVVSAAPHDSLIDAASRMQFNEVGSLAVMDGDALIGIITERDVVRAVADGVDPATTAVVGYMTPEPVTIPEWADVTEAAATMLRVGARHLPVVDGGRVIGMVSARDLLELEAESGYAGA